ncbi:MAG: MFS transporter, partial [Terriglobia bacterium]
MRCGGASPASGTVEILKSHAANPPLALDYRIISSLFLLLFLGLADNQMIAALLPVLVRAFRVSVATAGFLVVAYSILAAGAGLAAGTLSDRYGRRRFLLIAAIVFAAASWAASRTQTFPQLLAARALTGAAAGTISTCALAYAGDAFDYAVRGRALGLISIAYFAAPVIGVPLGAQLAAHFGWQSAFLFFGLLACVSGCGALLLPKDNLPPGQAFDWGRSVRTFQSFLRRRDLASGIGLGFLVSGGLVGFLTYIGAWLNAQFGLSTGGIGWVFMYAGVVAVIGAPLGGLLADRWGKRQVAIVGNVLLAGAVVLIPSFPWGAILLAVLGAASLGAALRQG